MSIPGIRSQITGQYRAGDIRHCFADITRVRAVLNFEPEVEFADGLRELVEWLASQAAVDLSDRALTELASRGLVS